MSKESYARGFCKAAEAAGIDPVALAKYAQVGITRWGPTVDNARLYDTIRGGLKPNSPYSTPSKPSKPSKPSTPSKPSKPSTPSKPSKPSTPSKPYHIPRLRPIDTLR